MAPSERTSSSRSGTWSVRGMLDTLASLAMMGAALVLVWTALTPAAGPPRRSATIPVPEEPVSLLGAPVIGSIKSGVAVIAFSDFECPFCGVFARDTYPRLYRELIESGRIAFAFRHFPLTRIHPLARRAAASSVCAAKQGRFAPMHDSLFTAPPKLDEPSLFARAVALGLNEEQFAKCMKDPDLEVQADIEAAKRLGIKSTPIFLIGYIVGDDTVQVSRVLVGARPAEDFHRAVEDAEKRRSGGGAS